MHGTPARWPAWARGWGSLMQLPHRSSVFRKGGRGRCHFLWAEASAADGESAQSAWRTEPAEILTRISFSTPVRLHRARFARRILRSFHVFALAGCLAEDYLHSVGRRRRQPQEACRAAAATTSTTGRGCAPLAAPSLAAARCSPPGCQRGVCPGGLTRASEPRGHFSDRRKFRLLIAHVLIQARLILLRPASVPPEFQCHQL